MHAPGLCRPSGQCPIVPTPLSDQQAKHTVLQPAVVISSAPCTVLLVAVSAGGTSLECSAQGWGFYWLKQHICIALDGCCICYRQAGHFAVVASFPAGRECERAKRSATCKVAIGVGTFCPAAHSSA